MVPGTGWFLRWGRGRRGRCCTVRAPDEYDDDDGDDGDGDGGGGCVPIMIFVPEYPIGEHDDDPHND